MAQTDGYIYDDRELHRLFAELSPKERRKAVKSALNRESARLLKAARSGLLSSMPGATRSLSNTVRRKVYDRKLLGFKVTAGTGKKQVSRRGVKIQGLTEGMYLNGRGEIKPVAMWAEGGTSQRQTKSRTRVFVRSRKGHPTGRMCPYGFIRKAADDLGPQITENMAAALREAVIKTAIRHGCIVQ